MTTMNASVCIAYGGPEVLKIKEVPRPTPKANEVLVKVMASSATQAETMMRKGEPKFGRLILGLTKPKKDVTGTGFSGVIEEIGAQVTDFKVGDEVYGETATEFGTNAEYLTIDTSGTILHKPAALAHNEAAVMCDGPITSMNFLQEQAQLKAGQQILIIGASGSLGTIAVQIAKQMGAEVTGVCSTANVGLVRMLGADHVIDYKKEDFTQGTKKYDVIYDTIGTSSFCVGKGLLKEKGIYMSPVLNGLLLFQMMVTGIIGKRRAKFSATGMLPPDQLKPMLKKITEWVALKKCMVVIDRVYPLQDIAKAHEYIDTGRKKGNVVIGLV